MNKAIDTQGNSMYIELGQPLFVCPSVWQTLHVGVRFLFPKIELGFLLRLLGLLLADELAGADVDADFDVHACSDVGFRAEGLVVEGLEDKGFGHVAARVNLQCIRMLSYKIPLSVKI